MTVIAVLGAPGVGKSFLAKQLGCYHCCPSFFEGEAGIFTKEVLAVLNREEDSPQRFLWLLERYRKNLEQAKAISEKLGIDCYVDGDILSFEAWLAAEKGKHSPAVLKRFLAKNSHLRADKVIVLVKTKKALLKSLEARGRKSEQTRFIFERALRVQKGCLELAKKYDHVLLIDRTKKDFTDEKQLSQLVGLIEAMPSLKR